MPTTEHTAVATSGVPSPTAGAGGGSWPQPSERPLVTLARNVATRYVLLLVNVLIGLFMLRYNVQRLGAETWGLWMLAAQVTAYFVVLDLGYGGAVVKFVAEFRAQRDARALNEVLSTMAYVFTAIGIACYAAAILVAVLLPYVFNLAPGQEGTGRIVLLMVAVHVALLFRFSIYGAVINGFERYYINNVVGLVFNVITAAVNVAVLWLGYGLVELVAATTIMRIVPLWVYRRNAYKVFPDLQIKWQLFRRDRLRELSGFSIYVAVVDWTGRLMFATDTFFIGIFMSTAAVAFYAVAQRIADNLLLLTSQIHTFMMPAIVDRAIGGDLRRQRSLMIRATRFQIAIAVCLCGGVATLARPIVESWLGPGWDSSVQATQLLALVVVLRASIAMPMTVLQGTGHHRYVAAVSSIGAVINLVLSVPMVMRWGVVGVAGATVIAAAVCTLLLFPKTCRVVQLGIWRGVSTVVVRASWPAAVVMVLAMAIQPALPAGLAAVSANLIAGGLVYGCLFAAFGLDREERHELIGAIRQLSRREARQQLATGDLAG